MHAAGRYTRKTVTGAFHLRKQPRNTTKKRNRKLMKASFLPVLRLNRRRRRQRKDQDEATLNSKTRRTGKISVYASAAAPQMEWKLKQK